MVETQFNSAQTGAHSAEASKAYTPLNAETIRNLQRAWSRPLAYGIDNWTKGKPGETPHQALVLTSAAERSNVTLTRQEWRSIMAKNLETTKNKFIMKLISKKQGENLTPDQAMETLMSKIEPFCLDEAGSIKINEFIAKVKEIYPSIGDFKKDFQDFTDFCQIFGTASGTAIAHFIGRLIDTDNTPPTESLNKDEQSLIDELQTQYDKAANLNATKIEAIGGNSQKTADQSGTPVQELQDRVTNNPEGDPLPENAGVAITGNRGIEHTDGDPRGQDRAFYKKLSNGVEIFDVNDGAGTSGHVVAEEIGPRLAQELSTMTPETITPEILSKIAKKIHSEMQLKFGQVSGATLDAVVKLPNNKRYALHVGEGFIGKIRFADEIKAKGQFGNIIDTLVQPQNFGTETNGEPIRTANGFKTAEIGVDAEINPVVLELPEGPIILASDGFSDVLASLTISTPELVQLIKSDPKKAAEYLCNIANKYAQQTYGKEADDISVMIIR